MGPTYIARVLVAISSSQPEQVADTELEPITPGAWAAWAAKGDERPTIVSATSTAAPAPAPVAIQPASGEA